MLRFVDSIPIAVAMSKGVNASAASEILSASCHAGLAPVLTWWWCGVQAVAASQQRESKARDFCGCIAIGSPILVVALGGRSAYD